jgi:hypothetical protein
MNIFLAIYFLTLIPQARFRGPLRLIRGYIRASPATTSLPSVSPKPQRTSQWTSCPFLSSGLYLIKYGIQLYEARLLDTLYVTEISLALASHRLIIRRRIRCPSKEIYTPGNHT